MLADRQNTTSIRGINMAGLLDIFNSPEGRLGIGLLSMAGPQSRPMGFGERLAGAFQMQDAYKQQLADEESRKLRNEFQTEQMNSARQRAAQERAAVEAAMRKQQALPSLLGETGVDVQSALAAGFSPDEIGKLGGLRNINANKVARTIKGIGQDGREYEYQVDEYGNRVGDGMAQFRAPIMQNLGDKTVALDPYTLQQKQAFAMGMSPESRASNALGWANNALAREAQQNSGGAKLPPGYRWTADMTGMEAIPGGPADAKAGEKGALRTQEARDALALIAQAKEIIPKATGSTIGAAVDAAGRAFGVSTGGDVATGQLKALEGALVAKMPKMTGPQSDRDVQMYRQMAAEIGDPTTPAPRKLAALQVVEDIQRRYAGIEQTSGQTARGTVGNAPADIQQLLNKY